MNEVFFQDISTTSAQIQSKQISPVDLTQSVLQRIEQLEPTLHAFIRINNVEALKQARSLESELMQGRVRGPLHGIPIAVKDIFEIKGSVTTAGSKMLADWQPSQDAFVIEKLREAGAILVGQTNMHEFAMGATTENPHYGTTRNPWDPSKIAGGSSGGSAVAVATGTAYGALGTDTAGSIRLPAAICGIVGLKPTYGVVSRKGCVPLAWSLDTIGPITRTVKDSAIMLKAIAGYDSRDAASVKKPLHIDLDAKLANLKGKKIGVCRTYFFDDLHPEMEKCVEDAIARFQELGAEVVEISIEGIPQALSSIRLINQSESYSFHEHMYRKFPEKYGEDLQYRLSQAKLVPASEYLAAQRFRTKFIAHVRELMKGCDLLLAPTNANPPFEVGTVPVEQAAMNIYKLGKVPVFNLLGFPTMTLPCGFDSAGLPVGMQLVGRPFDENMLILAGQLYESTVDWMNRLSTNTRYLSE